MMEMCIGHLVACFMLHREALHNAWRRVSRSHFDAFPLIEGLVFLRASLGFYLDPARCSFVGGSPGASFAFHVAAVSGQACFEAMRYKERWSYRVVEPILGHDSLERQRGWEFLFVFGCQFTKWLGVVSGRSSWSQGAAVASSF